MCEVAFFANQTYCCLSPFSDVAFAAQHYMILYFFEQTINIMESFPFSPGEIDILIVCIILFFVYYCLQMGSSEYVNPSMRTATGTTSGIPNGTEDNPTYVIMQNQKGMRQYYEKYCQIQHVLCIFMQLSPNRAISCNLHLHCVTFTLSCSWTNSQRQDNCTQDGRSIQELLIKKHMGFTATAYIMWAHYNSLYTSPQKDKC